MSTGGRLDLKLRIRGTVLRSEEHLIVPLLPQYSHALRIGSYPKARYIKLL